LNKHRYLE